jgi:signal transduction histidine kinase
MPIFPRARGISLELKLPLVTSALLLLLLGLYTWIAYQEVARTARSAASERNARLAEDLAQLTAVNTGTRARLVSRVVNRSNVQDAITNGAYDNLEAALDSLRVPSDSDFVIVIFDSLARPVHGAEQEGLHPEQLSRVPAQLPAANARDTLSLNTPFFMFGGNAHFWSVAAVKRAGRPVGYVAHLRTVRANPTAARALQSLIGPDNRILFANAGQERGPWISLEGRATRPPDREIQDENGWRYQRDDTWYIAGRKEIAGTPWQMIVEAPQAMAQTRPRQFLARIGLIGLLLLVVASVLVWFGSRRITGPIRHLRDAANAIERGQLGQRVDIDRADELGELGSSFNQMAAEVQRSMLAVQESRAEAQLANRSKSEFLANMSHEIRTPINAILGYTDLIEGGIAGEVTEQQRRHLERIRVSGNHLVGLIDDLLDFARLDVARLSVDKQVASAADSIRTAVTVVEPQAEAKNISLQVDCEDGAQYIGDSQRVEQILVNLLGNATKFTHSGGRVILECRGVEQQGKRETRFVVADTGIGIPADRLDAVFEPFVQAQGGYTRPHGGTGLGLSISRRLAELMGGSLTAESEVEVGSRFTLTLPAP